VVAHLIGILSECDPVKNGIKEIHVWSLRSVLDQLPDYSWLIKHNPQALEKNIFKQLIWQFSSLPKALRSERCDILYTQGASSLCLFKPNVVASQDMLSYEPGVMKYYGYGKARLRLLVILALQNLAFRRAEGVIFLNRYSSKVIQKSCGIVSNFTYIPHSADDKFNNITPLVPWPLVGQRPIRCIYVSNLDMYKHQWTVIDAISSLRKRGYDVTLKLVGGDQHSMAAKLVKNAIHRSSDKEVFVEHVKFVPHAEIPTLLAESDLFIFASSCETMPVTLIEGMFVGLPIACSDRGPMPEVLENGGVYFDPENALSIEGAIERILCSSDLRSSISKAAKSKARQYNWKQCSDDTFGYISKIYKEWNL
tara:strand:- start:236 stop:1333 length:1098 start_codon:yes stop_codon:yes gene_type:complete